MNRIGLSGIRRRLSGARASCSCVPATELLHLASSSQAMTYFRWPPKTQLSPCRNRMPYRKKYVLVSSHSARKPKPKFGRPLADSNDAISPVMPPLLNLRYHITGGGHRTKPQTMHSLSQQQLHGIGFYVRTATSTEQFCRALKDSSVHSWLILWLTPRLWLVISTDELWRRIQIEGLIGGE